LSDRLHEASIPRVYAETSNSGRRGSGLKAWHWAAAFLVLLGITWVPLLSVHLHRTTLRDTDSGTVVVVFPPLLTSKAVFQKVIDANGAMVRPVVWARHMWVVRSVEPGFAGRLRASGAWGVYSTDLLSADALWSCLRITKTPVPKR
jgi:hypothetical protein